VLIIAAPFFEHWQKRKVRSNSFTYDNAGRMSTVSDGKYSAAYSYLAYSDLLSQTLFKENSTTRMTTTRQHDRLNRLQTIASAPAGASSLPVAASYRYNEANQRTAAIQSDGSYWAYGYDALGQVISGKKHFADDSLVPGLQFEYDFDDIGNREWAKSEGDEPPNLKVRAFSP
jgi:YD repeat-containing protein